MPKMHIERSQFVNAPTSKVHSILADMNQWKEWSPWLISEPEAKVDVSDDKKHYSWTGKRVGQGNMSITSETAEKIQYDLTFLKPWKSKAKVAMDIKESDGGTEVTWSMDSKLPIFMFWMKKMMESFVGNDYERGLRLLKDYAEDGQVHSKLNFIGEQQYAGCDYVSIKRSCSIADMPSFMEGDFTKLMTAAHHTDNLSPEGAFCIYDKWDMVKQKVSYTAGVPYTGHAPKLDFDHEKGSIPATKIYTLEHVGPYEHLGNAWSTMYGMHRNKEYAFKKGIHPFETYGNSPKETDPKDLITRIHFAIKG